MSVRMNESWMATVDSVSHAILVVRLQNLRTGQELVGVRFDRGKLCFMDRRDEFPAFEREALVRLGSWPAVGIDKLPLRLEDKATLSAVTGLVGMTGLVTGWFLGGLWLALVLWAVFALVGWALSRRLS